MPVAPYQRAISQIRQWIADGSWPPGHQIPSRHHLAIELAMGDGSIRRAMTIMRRSGELEGTPRSRLYVAHPPAVRTLISPDAEWPGPYGDGGGTGSCVAPADVAERLGVTAGRRLHWVRAECLDPDLRPSHLVTTWWAGSRSGEWDRSVAEAEFHELSPAEADFLGLATGLRSWLVRRTRYLVDRPVETADLVLPADRWRLRLS